MYRSFHFAFFVITILSLGIVGTLIVSGDPGGDSGTEPDSNGSPVPPPFHVPSTTSIRPFMFPQPLLDQFGIIDSETVSAATQSDYSNFSRVTDEIEALSMRVPTAWRDIESGRWVRNGRDVGIYIAAAPDLGEYYAGRGAGVFFGASYILAGHDPVSNPATMINPVISQLLTNENAARVGRCRDGGRFDHVDNFYRGRYDLFLDCTQSQIDEIILVTMPAHQRFVSLVRISIASEADLRATTHIVNSYQVLNSSLEDDHHEHP